MASRGYRQNAKPMPKTNVPTSHHDHVNGTMAARWSTSQVNDRPSVFTALASISNRSQWADEMRCMPGAASAHCDQATIVAAAATAPAPGTRSRRTVARRSPRHHASGTHARPRKPKPQSTHVPANAAANWIAAERRRLATGLTISRITTRPHAMTSGSYEACAITAKHGLSASSHDDQYEARGPNRVLAMPCHATAATNDATTVGRRIDHSPPPSAWNNHESPGGWCTYGKPCATDSRTCGRSGRPRSSQNPKRSQFLQKTPK